MSKNDQFRSKTKKSSSKAYSTKIIPPLRRWDGFWGFYPATYSPGACWIALQQAVKPVPPSLVGNRRSGLVGGSRGFLRIWLLACTSDFVALRATEFWIMYQKVRAPQLFLYRMKVAVRGFWGYFWSRSFLSGTGTNFWSFFDQNDQKENFSLFDHGWLKGFQESFWDTWLTCPALSPLALPDEANFSQLGNGFLGASDRVQGWTRPSIWRSIRRNQNDSKNPRRFL